MKFLTTVYVKLRESGKRLTNGQTMTPSMRSFWRRSRSLYL